MKKPWFLRGIRTCGGWGKALTTTYTVLFSGKGLFHHPASTGDRLQQEIQNHTPGVLRGDCGHPVRDRKRETDQVLETNEEAVAHPIRQPEVPGSGGGLVGITRRGAWIDGRPRGLLARRFAAFFA